MDQNNSKEVGPLLCRGLRSEYAAVDRDLWVWYCRARSGKARPVSKSLLQKHARLAFSRAGITNFKASDGWYRRWISRWQKHCPANIKVSPLSGTSTEPGSQSQIMDHINSLPDVSKDGVGEIISAKEIHSSENDLVQLHFSEETEKHANESVVTEQALSEQSVLEALSSIVEKPEPLNCPVSELNKQSCSSKKDFATVDGNFLDFGCNPTNQDLCQNNLQLELNEKQKQPKSGSALCNEDERAKSSVNDDSLDIMDYLTLHVTESCESSQFGNSNSCMSYSNTIDHILNSATGDSIGGFLCCSMLGDKQAPPLIDVGLCSEHLDVDHFRVDHLREFASLVSQLSCSPPGTPKSSSSGQLVLQDDGTAAISRNVPNLGKSQLAGKLPTASSITNIEPQLEQVAQTSMGTGEAVRQDTPCQNPVAPTTAHQERKKKKKKKLSNKQLKKGERYLPKFKEKVLAYASTHKLKEAARKFKVKSATISAWKKDKIMLNPDVQSGQRPGGGEGASSADRQFLAWLQRCREVDHEVSREEVQQRAEQFLTQCSSTSETHKHNSWFVMWVERMKRQLDANQMELWVISERDKERHIKYPMAFKMEIAKFADRYSQTKASKAFNVTRKRVFEWLKVLKSQQNEPVSETESEVNPRSVGGRVAADVEVDRQIWEWYSLQTLKPSSSEVRQKGLELYRARGHADIKCSHNWYRCWSKRYQVAGRHDGDEVLLEWVLTRLEQGHAVSLADLQARALVLLGGTTTTPFKASPGWAIRFCKRYPGLLYRHPTVESQLPPALMTRVEEFRSCVRRIILEKGLKMSSVGSMDELHLNLSTLLPDNAETGVRRQLLRRPKMGNCHVTVVLACLADGGLLPPMVITRGNLDPLPVERDVLVVYQENAHMDEKCMKFWLQHIWFKKVASPSALVMDCYETHTLPSVRETCASCDTCCLVIPGGCTSKLQPLDITVKKSFQEAIKKHWTALHMQGSRSWADSKNLQLPGHQKVIEWIGTAYKHVLDTMQETIRRSFLVTGLTVAENHSEDHFIENLSMVPASS